jgi:hypothetical protein
MALTIIGQDTFTGVAGTHILDHTPGVGGSWKSVPNIKTDGVKIYFGIYVGHLTPYGMNGVPYYLNTSDFLNGYVQSRFFCWNQLSGYRVEIFARYNTATGQRIRLYPSSDGWIKVQDLPSGTTTTLACTGSWLKSDQRLKMVLDGASVKIYYWDYLTTWALQGEHTTAILSSGKCGFGVLEV